jgi:hypothetical protein
MSKTILPPDQLEEMPFPSKGVDVNSAYTQQPPGTTATGINVRVYDQLLMRARGGSRSGVTKYVPGQVAAGLIQDLNTVTFTTPTAIGSVNYLAGGTGVTTLPWPGTYSLAKITGSGFSVAEAMAVDGNGNLTVGAYQSGYPVGTDLQELPASQQINLPTNYFMLAYWQPGAFPLTASGWQTGDVFPGLGYFVNAFPGSTIDNGFGFPSAGAQEVNVPEPLPSELPFWYWPSGYETVELSINIGISRNILLRYLPPPTGALGMSVNSFPLPQVTAGGFYLITDDINATIGYGTTIPAGYFGLAGYGAFGIPDPIIFQKILTIPPTLLGQTPDVVGATLFNPSMLPCAVEVYGIFRFRKFLTPNWILAAQLYPTGAGPNWGPVIGPGFYVMEVGGFSTLTDSLTFGQI